MAALSEFMPFILPLVPGCPAPLAELTLRTVAIDFCTYAAVVQTVLDPIDVIADQFEYDLDVPFGTNVTLILNALYHGIPMAFAKTGDEPRFSGQLLPSHTGTSYAITQATDNTFQLNLVPPADDAGAIVLRVATRPTRSATHLDDVLLADYGYEIGAGTAARLMLMPGQLFSNPQLAAAYQAIYLAARTDARIRADKSFGRATTGVRPRQFI